MRPNTFVVRMDGGWAETMPEGDFECPNCAGIMLVVASAFGMTYAFCSDCKKYYCSKAFLESEEEKKE